jgi:hypothetical protein
MTPRKSTPTPDAPEKPKARARTPKAAPETVAASPLKSTVKAKAKPRAAVPPPVALPPPPPPPILVAPTPAAETPLLDTPAKRGRARRSAQALADATPPAPPVMAAPPVMESVPPTPVPPTVSEPRPDVQIQLTAAVATVLEAIQTGRAVEFIFTDADTNPPRTFEPRQLTFDVFSQAWFAWGWDRRYNAERHHQLDQLAEVNLVEGPGRAAQGPFAEGTPANQIGGWRGGEPIPVKALLMKQWIFAVRQSPAPFPEFRMEDVEDGKALVTFTATDLRAISRWCMQFGDGILVQEPQRLADRLKQVAMAWGAKPGAPPPPPPRPAKPEPQHSPSRRSRPEPRSESRPEPRPESRPEPRQEPHHEPRRRESHEAEKPAKPGRIEIRIDRL